MSGPSDKVGQSVESKTQLIDYIAAGCKPPEKWRIGTEHEKFVYNRQDYRRLAYDGEPGIKQLLEGLISLDWEPVYENDNIIALKGKNGGSITLEPGGQLELSGAPLTTIHETCAEVHTHLADVKRVCAMIGADTIGLGFDPQWRREDISWMPKGRYKIMKNYMPKRGSMGLDMMIRTCTVQVNLDFQSELDMIRKMRVSLALQPVATALFANSPFTEGKPNGFLSYRSHCWTDTDPDRSGMLPFVFEDGFGFERWVDYILDVPMYFVHRGEDYIDVSGKSFRDFMNGMLEGFEGQVPTMADWEDHMTTAFPEVRLKTFIEMRGADGGPWGNLCALPALWVGLLYNDDALDAAEALVSDWSIEEIAALRDNVPKLALNAPHRDGTVRDIAEQVLTIARKGLTQRQYPGHKTGRDEAHYLDALDSIVASGKTFAEDLLKDYEDDWGRSITPIYEACKY